MYSKPVNVNDLHEFCVDRLAPLFAWTGSPLCSYSFCARWFVMPFRDTLWWFLPGGFAIPCKYTQHHLYICPCLWRKNFYTPLYFNFLCYANFRWATASKQQWQQRNQLMCPECMAGCTCVAHCRIWLGGQRRVSCDGWVQDALLLFGYHVTELVSCDKARMAEQGARGL